MAVKSKIIYIERALRKQKGTGYATAFFSYERKTYCYKKNGVMKEYTDVGALRADNQISDNDMLVLITCYEDDLLLPGRLTCQLLSG